MMTLTNVSINIYIFFRIGYNYSKFLVYVLGYYYNVIVDLNIFHHK